MSIRETEHHVSLQHTYHSLRWQAALRELGVLQTAGEGIAKGQGLQAVGQVTWSHPHVAASPPHHRRVVMRPGVGSRRTRRPWRTAQPPSLRHDSGEGIREVVELPPRLPITACLHHCCKRTRIGKHEDINTRPNMLTFPLSVHEGLIGVRS